jgi:ferredoxin
MQVSVDRDRCTGHAQCNAVAPDVYDLDDDGYCVIPNNDVSAGLENQAENGAAACPEQAITVVP